MVENRKPIPVSEAVRLVMEYAEQGEVEEIPLDNCDGRMLAEEIFATHDVPPFHKSPYDGFAFRVEDTLGASSDSPVTLKISEHIPAGSVASKPLPRGQAVRIMTGAKIPDEANAVAMFEVCQTFERENQEYMSIKRALNAGDNIIIQGSETKKGTPLIQKGTYINPGVKALLATFGYSKIKVAKKPLVGLFSTGTELLQVEDELTPGKIRNSNSTMIASQIVRAGGDLRYFGTLEDDFERCFDEIESSLTKVDFLITTGGVSVGDYDLMPDIYDKLEAKVLFNKVAMRPGSVTTVAVRGNQLLFGLSGNPSACYVGFELFTRPVIKTALHTSAPHLPKIQATLASDFPKANPFTRFVRSKLSYDHGRVFVTPTGIDKSAVVTSLATTNCFMVLPGGSRGYKKGDLVDVLLLETNVGQDDTWTT